MKEYYQRHLPLHVRDTIGFALFVAWVFCTLFGCGLSSQDSSISGLPTNYSLERIWMINGLFEALGAIIGLIVASRKKTSCAFIQGRTFTLASALVAVLGTFFVWLTWAHNMAYFDCAHIIGGALCGLAVALFTLFWSSRLRVHDEAHQEFVIPFSFTVSFFLYFIILLTKQSGFSVLLLLIAMIALSAALGHTKPCENSNTTSQQKELFPHRKLSGLTSFTILVFTSWVQVAFFRVLSTPALMGNRFTHYLIPFSLACALSLVMLLLCIRLSRYMNISLAYRWSLPLFMLSYIPILIDYENPELRIFAYALNFLGMFGIQFGCWIGACKYMRRSGCSPVTLFGRYALGEGLGIFAGCLLGLYCVRMFDIQGILIVSFALMSIVIFAAMATGFNPNWIFHRTQSNISIPPDQPIDPPAERASDFYHESIEVIFRKEAHLLRKTFGLTERETDVVELLLAGRSRPFIRDELVVSINTVSSHVRSIFSKCEVHSQQELIDLARKSFTSSAATEDTPTTEQSTL